MLVFCLFKCWIRLCVSELIKLCLNNKGMVVINFSMVVINVWEILFVISLGLLLLNKLMDWNVRIILVIVFSKFNSGVIVVNSLIKLWFCFSFGSLIRMVLFNLNFRFFFFWVENCCVCSSICFNGLFGFGLDIFFICCRMFLDIYNK